MELPKESALVEDFVEYSIYSGAHLGSSPTDVAAIKSLHEAALAVTQQLIGDYIWQRDPFTLEICVDSEKTCFLYGRVSFGDNIEDEWLIVYLLLQLSRQFPFIVASVTDSDGQFLLIEAAEVLPRGLEPETSTNRVWIHEGQIHIIMPPTTPAQLVDAQLSHTKAVAIIAAGKTPTLATQAIQDAIAARVNIFPAAAVTHNRHRVQCVVPLRVAHVLAREPRLIAPAVNALYYRDTFELRSVAKMPVFDSTPLVRTSIRLTRCLYAMLAQQRFLAPACLPDVQKAAQGDERALDIGNKVAVGMELMYLSAQRRRQRAQRAREALASNEANAAGAARREMAESIAENYADTVDALLQQVCSVEQIATTIVPNDSDEWMEISPESVDQLAEERMMRQKRKATSASDKSQTQQAADKLAEMVEGMQAFVDKKSDVDGVELPSMDQPVKLSMRKFMSLLRSGTTDGDGAGNGDGDDDSGSDDDMLSEGDYAMGSDASDSDNDDDGGDMMADDNADDFDTILRRAAAARGSAPAQKLSLRDYMAAMDDELQSSTIGQSFLRQAGHKPAPKPDIPPVTDSPHASAAERVAGDSVNDDELPPVDIDVNLVSNLLQSLQGETGLPGPASTLLNAMGIRLPDDAD